MVRLNGNMRDVLGSKRNIIRVKVLVQSAGWNVLFLQNIHQVSCKIIVYFFMHPFLGHRELVIPMSLSCVSLKEKPRLNTFTAAI